MSFLIKIEGKNYPTSIMGEDNFTDFFGRDLFKSEEERIKEYLKALNIAYSNRVRGFSVANKDNLRHTIFEFKEINSDIVCIANPHFQSHYYLKSESLWTMKNREKLIATMLYRIREPIQVTWFNDINKNNVLTTQQINDIYLDEEEFESQIVSLKDYCDFCIVGNLWYNSLIFLGRTAYSHALDHSFAFYPITYSHNTRSLVRMTLDHSPSCHSHDTRSRVKPTSLL